MKHILEDDYNVLQLLDLIRQEASEAVDYIDEVISDYEGTPHESEHFNDVYLIENYVYNAHPQGDIKTSTWGRKGVYVFIMKEDLHLTSEQVRAYNSISGAGFFQIEEKLLTKGNHFYQGSSTSKSLHTRIKEHYSERTNISALQLNNRNRSFVRNSLKAFLFPVREELKQNAFFIKMIEHELHERHPAYTGSRRT